MSNETNTGWLTALATGIDAFSAIQQANALRAQAQYEADALKANARIAEIQAREAIAQGTREAQQHDLAVLGLLGVQQVKLAAQGLSLDVGSALALQQDTRRIGRLDTLTIKSNAWKRAWGLRVEASGYRLKGALGQLAAENQASDLVLTAGLESAREALKWYAAKPPRPDLNPEGVSGKDFKVPADLTVGVY